MSGGSLLSGLQGWFGAYRADTGAALSSAPPHRPRGTLIWFCLPGSGSLRAVAELVRRMRQERRSLVVLVTCPADCAVAALALPVGVLIQPGPADSPAAVRAFLDHWQPSVVVLTENDLPLGLIDAVARREVPLFLIDAHAVGKPRLWYRRGYGRNRTMLQHFERILLQDEEGARYFRRLGAPPWRMEVAGRMEQSSGALPCTEAERLALARLFSARPVWLAVAVPEAEEASVLAALRAALRMSHRLLLILVPEHSGRGPALAEHLVNELGWNVALRSREEDPDDEDQVYVADTEGEFGLWYRLAPISFMGGTLMGAGQPRHPFEVAALGSALIVGPEPGGWAESYAQLARAGALRSVRNAVDLGEAVSDLLAPDKAAKMALAAWDVASGGAEVTDRITRLLLDALKTQDALKAQDAGIKPTGQVPA